MKVPVFNIQRFSLHDGPGIRTTVFLMGCSLRCRWCHNPEGLEEKLRLQYDKKACIACGACEAVCPQDVHKLTQQHQVRFDLCRLCGKCIAACPAGALQYSGKYYTPEALTQNIVRDALFYKDGGGVTFSGGEPLLHADFVAEAGKLCKAKGVPSVAVDTAGNVSWEAFESVLSVTDHFLFDIKAATETLHIVGTGQSNLQILENLYRLDSQGKTIDIRIPVIPGFNDKEEEIRKIGQIIGSLKSVREVRLLPYHTFGREKYETLGLAKPECFPVPQGEVIKQLEKIISNRGE